MEVRGHHSPRPRRATPSSPPANKKIQQYQEGERRHNSTRSRNIIPSPQLSKRESTAVSRWRDGGRKGHNCPRPRRTIRSPLPSKREMKSNHEEGRVHSSSRLRSTKPFAPPSNERIRRTQDVTSGHNSSRPRRTIPPTPLSARENTAVSRGSEGAQQGQFIPPSTRENTAVSSRGKVHQSTRPRMIILSTSPSKPIVEYRSIERE